MAAFYDNPIQSVTPYPSGVAVTNLVAPSVFDYELYDVSAAGATRTEDYVMQKKRAGQSRGLPVEWENISYAQAAAVLQAFNSEYVTVNHLDGLLGAWKNTVFYVTDRKCSKAKIPGIWKSVTFSLIERAITTP